MRNQIACEYEHTVIKSFKSGFSTDEIKEHLRICADCQETARVVGFFQMNLIKESTPVNLPSAGLVWWKSRLREKQRAANRVNQPILIVQTVAVVIFAGLLVWLFNNGWLGFLALDRILDSIDKVFVPLFAGTIGFLFVCLILIFTLRRYLLEK